MNSLNYAALLLISLIAFLPFDARCPSAPPAVARAVRLPRGLSLSLPLPAAISADDLADAAGRVDDEVDDEVSNPIGYETPGVAPSSEWGGEADASPVGSFEPEASDAPEPGDGGGSDKRGDKNGASGEDASAKPSPSPREFPCRVKFELAKRYTTFPDFVYECTKQHQFRAQVFAASCPDGYVRQTHTCLRQGGECQFAPKQQPECVMPACPDSEYRLIDSVATCLKCPKTYTLFQEDGIHKCSKLLVEEPVCASPDQTFDMTVGQCV